MAKKLIRVVASLILMGAVLLSTSRQVRAQVQAAPYPAAVPLDRYFMSVKASEIELARSAAPSSVANEAEVLVLAPGGYITAVKGGNGFVCLVERSWAKTTDDPEFWNPKVRAPICVNAPAARTYLPIVLAKTRLVLAGKSRTEIARALQSAWRKKEFPALEPNAM